VNAQAPLLRCYRTADEAAAIELWQRAWQKAYPNIDFAERTDWWRKRWRGELVQQATIVVAEMDGTLAGYVAIDPRSGYLDQIVVAPELWGSELATLLLDEAKRISPSRIDLLVNKDNTRAIGFYQKHGFVLAGDDVNPVSGRPVNKMSWRR
jgi:putative acetyltransferase